MATGGRGDGRAAGRPFAYSLVAGADHFNYLPKAQARLATALLQDHADQPFTKVFDFDAYRRGLKP